MKPPSDTIPPWKLPLPNIDLRLSSLFKQTTGPLVYQKQFQGMREAYPDHVFLFTDGSLYNDAVACGFYCIGATKSYRLHSQCSIFTAEIHAILEALKYIESTTLRRVVIICSVSLSSLQAVSCFSSDPLTNSVKNLIHRLLSRQHDLTLSWVPGHVGIIGKELADQAAKSATRKTRIDIPFVPLSDMKAFLKRSVFRAWQTEWHNSTFKLKAIKNFINPWRSSSRSSRHEEVILMRLRIGNCHFSHGFLLRGETSPIGDSWRIVLSV